MDQVAIGKRLAMLRKEKNLTQTQLATKVMNINENIGTITGINISSYESGYRVPTLEKLVAFATFFEVSVDYLLGLNENSKPHISNTKNTTDGLALLEPDTVIPLSQLGKYHAQPVFVVCPDTVFHNRWAILDYFNKRLVFVNEIYPITENTKLYNYVPLSSAYASYNLPRPLNINQLFNNDMFWVEVLSNDGQVKGEYNGWYRHNENRSMLINCSNGLMLPYTGIGISYNAFLINAK